MSDKLTSNERMELRASAEEVRLVLRVLRLHLDVLAKAVLDGPVTELSSARAKYEGALSSIKFLESVIKEPVRPPSP